MSPHGAMIGARAHGLEVIVVVVAPSETGEIAFGVVWADLAIGSGDHALDVAERRIDPFEGRRADCLGSRAGVDCGIGVGALAEHTPTAEAIGDDLASRNQPTRDTARDLPLAGAPDGSQLPSLGSSRDGSVAKSGWLVTCLRDLPRGVEA